MALAMISPTMSPSGMARELLDQLLGEVVNAGEVGAADDPRRLGGFLRLF